MENQRQLFQCQLNLKQDLDVSIHFIQISSAHAIIMDSLTSHTCIMTLRTPPNIPSLISHSAILAPMPVTIKARIKEPGQKMIQSYLRYSWSIGKLNSQGNTKVVSFQPWRRMSSTSNLTSNLEVSVFVDILVLALNSDQQ